MVAEYRLLLRSDNADLRLTEIGRKAGLVSDAHYSAFCDRRDVVQTEIERLRSVRVDPTPRLQSALDKRKSSHIKERVLLKDLLRRPEVSYDLIREVSPPEVELAERDRESVEVHLKYEGYIDRQETQVARFRDLEKKLIPDDLAYDAMPQLSHEAGEKLMRVKPRSLGQASRIPGVSPADISVLMITLRKWQAS